MSQVKPFLLALSLLPISLSAFQISALAQFSISSPSKGLAGSVSGNNSLSIIYTNDKTQKEIVTTLTRDQQTALNLKAMAIRDALGGDTDTLKTVVNTTRSTDWLTAALGKVASAQDAYTGLMKLNRPVPTTADGFNQYKPDLVNTAKTMAGGTTISYSIESEAAIAAATAASIAASIAANPAIDAGAARKARTAAQAAARKAASAASFAASRDAASDAASRDAASLAANDANDAADDKAGTGSLLAKTGKAINAVLDVYSEKITIANGKNTLILDTSKYDKANRAAAVSAAAAVLEAGGSVAEAQLAASLAGTGADIKACLALVASLSGLFADNTISSLPTTIPTAFLNNSSLLTATGIKTKSLDFGKNLIAQTRAAVQVDANKLNRVLLAYNDLIDKSTPEAVANLAKNEDFKLIGQNLRDLRASIR